MRAALLLAILVSFAAAPALAHGDAAWIMDNPQTLHCCGPHDCEPLPEGAVKETTDGFEIVATGEVIHWAEGRIYTSIDERYWWCHYPERHPDDGGDDAVAVPRTRCLFVPGNT